MWYSNTLWDCGHASPRGQEPYDSMHKVEDKLSSSSSSSACNKLAHLLAYCDQQQSCHPDVLTESRHLLFALMRGHDVVQDG
jgi:hypothetical protein